MNAMLAGSGCQRTLTTGKRPVGDSLGKDRCWEKIAGKPQDCSAASGTPSACACSGSTLILLPFFRDGREIRGLFVLPNSNATLYSQSGETRCSRTCQNPLVFRKRGTSSIFRGRSFITNSSLARGHAEYIDEILFWWAQRNRVGRGIVQGGGRLLNQTMGRDMACFEKLL